MSFTTGLAHHVKRSITKEDVLQKAKDLVTGDRNDTHVMRLIIMQRLQSFGIYF